MLVGIKRTPLGHYERGALKKVWSQHLIKNDKNGREWYAPALARAFLHVSETMLCDLQRKPRRDDNARQKAAKLRREGLTLKDIAMQVGKSRSWVESALRTSNGLASLEGLRVRTRKFQSAFGRIVTYSFLPDLKRVNGIRENLQPIPIYSGLTHFDQVANDFRFDQRILRKLLQKIREPIIRKPGKTKDGRLCLRSYISAAAIEKIKSRRGLTLGMLMELLGTKKDNTMRLIKKFKLGVGRGQYSRHKAEQLRASKVQIGSRTYWSLVPNHSRTTSNVFNNAAPSHEALTRNKGGRPIDPRTAAIYEFCRNEYQTKGAPVVMLRCNKEFGHGTIKNESHVREYAKRFESNPEEYKEKAHIYWKTQAKLAGSQNRHKTLL